MQLTCLPCKLHCIQNKTNFREDSVHVCETFCSRLQGDDGGEAASRLRYAAMLILHIHIHTHSMLSMHLHPPPPPILEFFSLSFTFI
mmetsp:Transcript_33483/g.81088  ORF Transcript_33483/g.81088 Transcript_33483/m.81088 type:complete len:87 (-) Transcript_33483:1821-2081(-)